MFSNVTYFPHIPLALFDNNLDDWIGIIIDIISKQVAEANITPELPNIRVFTKKIERGMFMIAIKIYRYVCIFNLPDALTTYIYIVVNA